MRRRWHRLVIFAWVALMSIGFTQATAYAEYTVLRKDTTARVIAVIDGDALMVSLNDSGETALVRLAGIATRGNHDALVYMTDQLLGCDVELLLDAYGNNMTVDGRWTPVYVYYGNTLYNRVLLQKGLAQVDTAYRNFSLYNTFANDERIARTRALGLWTTGVQTFSGAYLTEVLGYDRVNINLATASQIQSKLSGVNSASARAIVQYRSNEPYRAVGDIKYAGVLTRAQYDAYAPILTVCTNINTASQEELRMTGLTLSEARSIIEYRNKRLFTNITQLYTEEVISEYTYDEISDYIATYDVDFLSLPANHKLADINYDNAATLHTAASAAGLTLSKARTLVSARGQGYTMKSLGEIQKIDGLNLSDDQINRLAAYLYANTGSSATPAYININTATQETLLGVGFSQQEALLIQDAQRSRMLSGKDIPFDLGRLDAYVTLYTCINATTTTELLSLSGQMTERFATVLIEAAAAQPFGTMDELSDFFAEQGESRLFSSLRAYIVLR